ncbi:TetR/AcrR family transcriptional regulator [Actinomadura sediminis]|uniref:TetR/AcrR family transcriptional regulator n=1 Tax=Actinomadura sediminis TaxID=1038904 RepID=A0ABW3EX15_9ACTN
MGHREDLLAGAKRCLYERGYGRTTARDIVAASGTNLGSIGYHFGSKDALLTAAIIDSFAEWGAELDAVMGSLTTAADADSEADWFERFEHACTLLIESFDGHRALWVSAVEAFAQAEHIPEVRRQLSASLEETREGLVEVLERFASHVSSRTARTSASLLIALLPGLALQWLLDPERAPTGEELGHALRELLHGPSGP